MTLAASGALSGALASIPSPPVFDTAAANPYHFPPRWLDEGLAV